MTTNGKDMDKILAAFAEHTPRLEELEHQAEPFHFAIAHAAVEVTGLCRQCRKA
jgi:Fe2+ or Zn2+ uptake regulation protein